MKVYIKDKRSNPKVIYIDGKRYVLPSNKEVIKDISATAFNNLSAMACLSIREYVESEVKQEENKQINEEPVIDIKEPETVVESVSEPEINQEEHKNLDSSEELEESNEKVVEVAFDYSSMTKSQLKEAMVEKGGDPSGMTKSNIIDWLNSHI